MYEQALVGFETALGLNHTSIPTSMNSLGLVYNKQGRLSEAEKIFQRALAGFETALGPDHVSTLAVVRSLERVRGANWRYQI